MELATGLQKICKEVYYENIGNDSMLDKAKAVGAAMLSGAIDGACIVYIPLVVSNLVLRRQLKKTK